MTLIWIGAAISAHMLFALGFLIDKYLLVKPVRNPAVNAMLAGFLGILALLLAPFGFEWLDARLALVSLAAGGAFLAGLVFFLAALKSSEISRIVPFAGVLVPLSSLAFGTFLLETPLAGSEGLSFLFLLSGGALMVMGTGHPTLKSLALSAGAGLFFGLSFVLTKMTFEDTNFINGFIWIRIGAFFAGLALLALPSVRADLKEAEGSDDAKKTGTLFLLSKSLSGAAMLLQTYAISLGSVVLVNALQSTQYLFLLLAASLFAIKWPAIFGEHRSKMIVIQKLVATGLVGLGFLLLVRPAPHDLKLGVTFSQKFAEELAGDWRTPYTAILDDLQVKRLRLIAYWDLVEREEGKFDFADLAWQIEEAEKRGAEVILALGYKTPRWPECHVPAWAREGAIVKRGKILEYLEKTVRGLSSHPNITAWQVENEPLFPFGECEILGPDFLDEEANLVRSLDSRPVIFTDSGELGFAWPLLIARGDAFGTTLYRKVYNSAFGYVDYWFVPEHYFLLKSALAGWYGKPAIVAELQAEPWILGSVKSASPDLQLEHMNPRIMEEILDYTSRSGFDSAYFWGVEWWYWMRSEHNRPEMWDMGRELFRP